MSEFEKYKKYLVGETLNNLFHSDLGKGIEHLNGLGDAHYFSTVLELENGEKFIFGNEWINKFDESEKLFNINHNTWVYDKNNIFNNILIIEILIDEYNEIYIKLENDVIIYHSIDYGDKLYIEKYSEVFDRKGNLREDEIITSEKPFNKEKSFWHYFKHFWY